MDKTDTVTVEQAAFENAKLHYIGALSEELIAESIIDFKAGAEWQASRLTTTPESDKTGLRWVKASERLPEGKHDVLIKVDGVSADVGWYNKDKESWFTDRDTAYEDSRIEWLEEIPATPQQDSKEKEAMDMRLLLTEADMNKVLNLWQSGNKVEAVKLFGKLSPYSVSLVERVDYIKAWNEKYNQAQQDTTPLENPPAQPASVSEGQGRKSEMVIVADYAAKNVPEHLQDPTDILTFIGGFMRGYKFKIPSSPSTAASDK